MTVRDCALFKKPAAACLNKSSSLFCHETAVFRLNATRERRMKAKKQAGPPEPPIKKGNDKKTLKILPGTSYYSLFNPFYPISALK